VIKVTGIAGNAIQAYNTADTCRDNSVLNSQVPGYGCGHMSGVNDDN
jgi:hypothetical protein